MKTQQNKKIVKTTPRRERLKPTVVSTLWPESFNLVAKEKSSTCFVSVMDYRELERKYFKLFKKFKMLQQEVKQNAMEKIDSNLSYLP